MRVRGLAAFLVLLGACRGSCLRPEQTRDVALGWRGKVDDFSTSCTPVATPTKVVATGSSYEAVAVGTEDFDCDGSRVHLRVSPAARIEIAFPSTIVVWENHPLVVTGDDGHGRKLDLGEGYTYTTAGVVQYASCGDMDLLCGLAGPATPPLVAKTTGRGAITASFLGLTATRDVTAIARPDAGAD